MHFLFGMGGQISVYKIQMLLLRKIELKEVKGRKIVVKNIIRMQNTENVFSKVHEN